MAETYSFGNWIRQRRRALDLTQDGLADRVGCSISAIRKIEADERRPSRQVAELLADTLQIPGADRAIFLKVARMELGFDRLSAITAPAVQAPAISPAISPAVLPQAGAQAAAPTNGGAQPPAILLNLPHPPTPLVGREIELARIAEILSGPECRLLTLSGPGGIGKTRLAIAAAERLAHDFADGACFVPLAVVTAPGAIWTAIAGALGLHLRTAEEPRIQLTSYLQGKHLLLVLDNLEHLLEGVDIITDILQGAPGIRVLTTSRERLGLSGEWVLDIQGLGVPAPAAAQAQDGSAELPEAWDRASAVVLFLQAARRANPQFVPGAADYGAIVRICEMVEGIPLGIELAAAWVRMLTCAEIAAEIARSFDLLATSARDVPQRQRSLRAAFEHSWHLLPEDERKILQALSVFSGGFTRRAADAVAGAALVSLAALMAKSLAVRAGEGRYDLHDIVRQYAAEKLEQAGAAGAVRRRHGEYFINLAEEADAARNSPQYMGLVDQLELENDNLQSALADLLVHDRERAWRLAGLLEPYWYRRPVYEAQRWLAHLVELGGESGRPVPPGLRARVLLVLAGFEASLADLIAKMHDILALARQAGDRRIMAIALGLLGNEGIFGGGFEHTEAYFAEAWRLAEAAGDKATLAIVLAQQGECVRYEGHYARAIELYTASVELAQEIGRADLVAGTQFSLAKMALRQGDPPKALALIGPTLQVWEDSHDRVSLANAQILVARALIMQGEFERAAATLDEAQAILHDTGYYGHDQIIAYGRASIAYSLGNLQAAEQLYARTIQLCAISTEPIVLTLAQRGVACCALRRGDLARAQAAVAQSIQVCEATHEKWVRALLEFTSGQLAWRRGERTLAEAHYRTGLRQVALLGEQYAAAEALEQWALVDVHNGHPERASKLFGAAGALRQKIAAPVPPIDRRGIEEGIAAAQAALGPAQFKSAWEFGAAQAAAGLPETVALALENE